MARWRGALRRGTSPWQSEASARSTHSSRVAREDLAQVAVASPEAARMGRQYLAVEVAATALTCAIAVLGVML